MSKATAYTATGTKSTTAVTLPKGIFDQEVKNHRLLQEAYRAYLAAGRAGSAKTLTRAEVRGGGRKPWRQKGTGRARAGSRTSPIWRGGGVTFGPTGSENPRLKLSVKAKRKAVAQALSLKAQADAVVVIEEFKITDGKTKTAANLLSKLGAKRRVLVVVDTKTEQQQRSLANLPEVELVSASYLNVFKVLNADVIVMSKKAVAAVEAWLVPSKPKAKAGTK